MATKNTQDPLTNSSITLSLLNDSAQKAEVYVDQSATLDVVLTNNTGSDIGLSTRSTQATLKIYLPEFYTSVDLKNMQIELSNWTLAIPLCAVY